jgi:flagellar M-ring protein FliF
MNQLTQAVTGLSLSQKISILAAAILTVGGLYGFSRWKHESDFRPLYTSMAAEDAAAVVQKLRETGVEYRLSESGSAVLVSSTKLAESRLTLAAAGLPKTGRIGFELFDKTSFGTTDFVEHINYKRALEGELERSMMSLAEVEEARVHLTLPKDSVFLEQQQPAKASVVLKLRPGAQVSAQNVAAVTNLVASAVEGLAPESVSVVDMNGNLLSRPRRSGAADGAEVTTEALEVRQQIERDLVTKIHATLEPLLGADRFRAGASVECDLSSGEQQEEIFDPTHSVMASSQKTEDVMERGGQASGIPGTASNLPRGGSGPSGPNGGGTTRRTEAMTYQTSRVVKHTRIPQGIIKHMSLAVLLDQAVHWEGQGASRQRVFDPPKPEMIQSLKGLIAAATGLNMERGDQLIIESLPFESTQNAEPPAPAAKKAKPVTGPPEPAWQQFVTKYKDVAGMVAMGIALLTFILRMVIGMFRSKGRREPEVTRELPAAVQEPGALPVANRAGTPYDMARVSASTENTMDVPERVRELARRDTALAANVVRAWLQEEKSRA